MAGQARDGSRRDARRGVLVTEIRFAAKLRVRFGNKLAAVDLEFDVEDRRIDCLVVLAHEQVGKNDHRTLIALGKVERQRRRVEAVCHVDRGDDDAWEVALTRAESLVQIRLFGLRRHAGGRTRPHHVHGHNRRFDHTSHTDRL